MSHDPFSQFESSRGGWLIPIALFIVGAIGTTIAINAVHDTAVPRPPAIIQEQPAS